ncbi:MAG: Lrp/AsnC family transcriptional regulator [Candidatus Micrarchaeota archaeon]
MDENLDSIDSKIIEELQQDARISYTELAKKLKLSDVAVRKRIDKLVGNKIIRNFSIAVDYAKLGKPIYAFLLVKTLPAESENARSRIKRMSDIIEVIPVMGEYDFIVEAIAPDMPSLKKLVDDNLSNIKGVLEIRALITL